MNRQTLLELADRCEQATGPDKVLDFWIGVRLHPCRHTDAELQADIDALGIDGMAIDAPYTASLDAALTLVPDEFEWLVRSDGPYGFANVSKRGEKPVPVVVTVGAENEVVFAAHDPEAFEATHNHSEAATAPLALCAAALRARAKGAGE